MKRTRYLFTVEITIDDREKTSAERLRGMLEKGVACMNGHSDPEDMLNHDYRVKATSRGQVHEDA